MMAKPAEVPMSAWLAYLNVGKLAEATARAESLGAKKLMGPHSMPGIGTWNVIAEVFEKRTRKTPQSVIDTCRRRLKDYDA